MSRLGAILKAGRAFGVRDGMLRLEYELQRGSGLMAQKMRAVEGWHAWHLGRIAPGVSPEELLARISGSQTFFFPNALAVSPNLKELLGHDAQQPILAQAESILAGRLPYFGDLSYACAFPPRWFENASTAARVDPHQPWTQMRFASPVYGDLKFVLEPSRFLFAYTLVRAYALTGDEKFPEAFWKAIEDWASQSPPMSGPLWICGQECSLRILAWSFALHAFIVSPRTTPRRLALLVSMIAAHAWRTAQTLDYARSQRSNHLISEAVGLWTAGTLFPELAGAQRWQNLGAETLYEAVVDQISPAGVSHQHSFNYQRMILHQLLWTLRLAEIHSAPLAAEISTRTRAAYDFIRTLADPSSGLAPNHGSNDGTNIFPLSTSSFRDFRPLLQLGAAILDRPSLDSGPWAEAALWFGLKPAPAAPSAEQIHTTPDLSSAGYVRLGDKKSWALIRAGKYTRRPFQADQLHTDLWWNGINIARDAGTYLYNGPAPWNNALAGTAVHNTVTVDHRDQMRRAGRFLWLDWAQASGRSSHLRHSNHPDYFSGEHNGYRKLGVLHRRSIHWLGDAWIVIDDLSGTGVHDLRLHWLAPQAPFDFRESPLQLVFHPSALHIQWNIFSSAPSRAMLIRGGKPIFADCNSQGGFPRPSASNAELPALADHSTHLLGWESPTYGDLRPALSIVQETRSQLPVRFITVVLCGETPKIQSAADLVTIERRTNRIPELVRIPLSPSQPCTFETPHSESALSSAPQP